MKCIIPRAEDVSANVTPEFSSLTDMSIISINFEVLTAGWLFSCFSTVFSMSKSKNISIQQDLKRRSSYTHLCRRVSGVWRDAWYKCAVEELVQLLGVCCVPFWRQPTEGAHGNTLLHWVLFTHRERDMEIIFIILIKNKSKLGTIYCRSQTKWSRSIRYWWIKVNYLAKTSAIAYIFVSLDPLSCEILQTGHVIFCKHCPVSQTRLKGVVHF